MDNAAEKVKIVGPIGLVEKAFCLANTYLSKSKCALEFYPSDRRRIKVRALPTY